MTAVPSWLVGDDGELQSAARSCADAADAARAAGRAVSSAAGGAALAASWNGRAATVAGSAAERQVDRFARLASALDEASYALARMSRDLDELGARVRDAQRQADDLRRRLRVEAVLGAAALVKDAVGGGLTELRHELSGVERRLAVLVDEAVRADGRCAGVLAEAAAVLAGLVDCVLPTTGWVTSAVPAGSVGALRSLGLLRLEDDAALVAALRAQPPGEAGTRRVRELLAARSAAEVAALLEACPDVAARLVGGMPTSLSPAGSGLCRVQSVRALFASLTPDDARLLVLLHPSLGGVDGVPLPDRIAANRVLVTVALADRRAELALLESRRDRLADDWQPWNDDDLDGTVAGVAARIRFYEDLLSEPTPAIGRRPGEPLTVAGHQVLLFSDDGDGAFAELWGRIDDRTANVGVLVPGTGTDMTNVGRFSADRALRFAAERASGDLAMIAWMGGDLPDSVLRDAPFRNYADDLGPRLRDFTSGLDVPTTAAVTVAGHSYGGAVVGVAEREGLVADRVLHIESAGAGHGVDDVDDYAHPGADRYSMTAPGDVIGLTQGVEVWRTGHGADPDELSGVVRLETGRVDADDPNSPLVEGPGSHSGVFDTTTTAWENLYQVFTGGEVLAYAPPTAHVLPGYGPHPVVVVEHPMADPSYVPPRVDVE